MLPAQIQVPVVKVFRLKAKWIHLTYKSHVNHEQLLAFLRPKGREFKWYSIVHEVGHEPDTDAAIENEHRGYDHTHVACEWQAAVETRNPRFFDFGDIHPHIQKITGNPHACKLYEDYHRKSPVLLTQSETTPRAHAFSEEGIKGAMSLYDACKSMDIEIKSVADVLLIRNDKRKREAFKHAYAGTKWTIDPPGDFRCLYVWGRSGTGKTQWAVHLFENPLVVRDLDTLREFDPSTHDGIVFDDINFNQHSREGIIHLTDWDMESAIRCRYSNGIIPPHTKKVFTSNKTFSENMLHGKADYAITRRFTDVIHVTENTYETAGAVLVPGESEWARRGREWHEAHPDEADEEHLVVPGLFLNGFQDLRGPDPEVPPGLVQQPEEDLAGGGAAPATGPPVYPAWAMFPAWTALEGDQYLPWPPVTKQPDFIDLAIEAFHEEDPMEVIDKDDIYKALEEGDTQFDFDRDFDLN